MEYKKSCFTVLFWCPLLPFLECCKYEIHYCIVLCILYIQYWIESNNLYIYIYRVYSFSFLHTQLLAIQAPCFLTTLTAVNFRPICIPLAPTTKQKNVNINTGHNNILATYTWAAPQANVRLFSLEGNVVKMWWRCWIPYIVESDVKLLMAEVFWCYSQHAALLAVSLQSEILYSFHLSYANMHQRVKSEQFALWGERREDNIQYYLLSIQYIFWVRNIQIIRVISLVSQSFG